jgi:hypothetical protein
MTTIAAIATKIAEVRKALVSAALVASTLATTEGVPADIKAWAAEVLIVLAAAGITWTVSNKPAA